MSISQRINQYTGPNHTIEIGQVVEAIYRTKSDLYRRFWGLKENWWMQLIDGRFHVWGPKVFDEALHGNEKEPGFLSSAYKACRFASQHLGKLPNVSFYKQLHRIACAHFDGVFTNMKGEEAGMFNPAVMCRGTYESIFPDMTPSEIEFLKRQSSIAEKGKYYEALDPEEQVEVRQKSGFVVEEEYLTALQKAREVTAAFTQRIESRLQETNTEIASKSTKLGLKPIVELYLDCNYFPWPLRAYYQVKYTGQSVDKVVESLFAKFSKDIVKAKTQDKKIELIAEFFQMLEWIHPFPDGQGRTDLILLAKLLTEHGLNPPILHRPYYSTYSPLKDWSRYLKNGIDKWIRTQTVMFEY